MSDQEKPKVIVSLSEGVEIPPLFLQQKPFDEIPSRTGEFLMRGNVPVPPEPLLVEQIELEAHELQEDEDEPDPGRPPSLPSSPLRASQDPAIMAEIEATTREVRERAAARERSALLGSPIPPMIAEKTALHRPKTTMEDVKRIAGAAIAKENARREREKKEADEQQEAEAKETARLAEVARAEAAATATATRAVVERYQEDFFKEGDDPLPPDKDTVLASTSPTDQKSKGDKEKRSVLFEPWWKEFKIPTFNLPRISMPWGGQKTKVTDRDEDGYLKSSMASPAKKKAHFAAIVVVGVLLIFAFAFWSIFAEDKVIPTSGKPAKIAKVAPPPQKQPKEVKQTATSDNTIVAAPVTPPSVAAPVEKVVLPVAKAPVAAPQASARQPTLVAKAPSLVLPPPKTVVQKVPAVALVPVPATPPTEVCIGAQVHCSEGLAACLERVTLAHDKYVAKGACTWKCGAPCILPTATQAHVAPPSVVAPEPSSEPAPSLATSSPPAVAAAAFAGKSSVPCPEGKELCILKFKLRLGEAAARGACWRCTK